MRRIEEIRKYVRESWPGRSSPVAAEDVTALEADRMQRGVEVTALAIDYGFCRGYWTCLRDVEFDRSEAAQGEKRARPELEETWKVRARYTRDELMEMVKGMSDGALLDIEDFIAWEYGHGDGNSEDISNRMSDEDMDRYYVAIGALKESPRLVWVLRNVLDLGECGKIRTEGESGDRLWNLQGEDRLRGELMEFALTRPATEVACLYHMAKKWVEL